jgi:hypothetical protein
MHNNEGFAEFVENQDDDPDLTNKNNFTKIPKEKIPLLGSQFLPEEQEIFCKIY